MDIFLRLNHGFEIDEKIENLEEEYKKKKESNAKMITMVMVTHDEYMKSLCDRVLMIRDGKIADEEIMDPKQKF